MFTLLSNKISQEPLPFVSISTTSILPWQNPLQVATQFVWIGKIWKEIRCTIFERLESSQFLIKVPFKLKLYWRLKLKRATNLQAPIKVGYPILSKTFFEKSFIKIVVQNIQAFLVHLSIGNRRPSFTEYIWCLAHKSVNRDGAIIYGPLIFKRALNRHYCWSFDENCQVQNMKRGISQYEDFNNITHSSTVNNAYFQRDS